MTAPRSRQQILILWIVAAVAAFAGSLWLMARGDETVSDDVESSTYSRSALGHAGIAELLKRQGVTVVQSRFDSVGRVNPGGVLVIAEPKPATLATEATALIGNANRTLLVLPKWRGVERSLHDGWLGRVVERPLAEVRLTLALVDADAAVVRVAPPISWSQNEIRVTPSIEGAVQMIAPAAASARRIKPLIAAPEGILLGEIVDGKRRIWVLADPDVIANHGIGRGENAALALAIIERARNGQRRIVFDETVHGYAVQPAGPLAMLVQFPFVVVTVLGLVTAALLLWATAGRFGAPMATTRALRAGKQELIAQAADLLDFAGHHRAVVTRYIEAVTRDAARQLHAPNGLSTAARLDWLARVGTARGVSIDCREVARLIGERALSERQEIDGMIALARDIHRWKREIVDAGSGHRHAR